MKNKLKIFIATLTLLISLTGTALANTATATPPELTSLVNTLNNMSYEQLKALAVQASEVNEDSGKLIYCIYNFDGHTCIDFCKDTYISKNNEIYRYTWGTTFDYNSKKNLGKPGVGILRDYPFDALDQLGLKMQNGVLVPLNAKISTTVISNQFDAANALESNFDSIVIASGKTFADSLCGCVLAKKVNAPVMFVNTPDDSKVLNYINSHLSKSGTLYILGGTGAVSQDIEDKFINMGFTNIKRLGGSTRYETSELVNDELNVPQGTPVVIAYGENYPDALSISSIAAQKGYPILLSKTNDLTSYTTDELNKIKPSTVYVVGGNGVISDSTMQQIKQITGATVKRLWGQNRYDTSLAIVNELGLNNSSIAFATDTNFMDTMYGSMYAAKENSSVLLVPDLPTKQQNYLKGKGFTNYIFLGQLKDRFYIMQSLMNN